MRLKGIFMGMLALAIGSAGGFGARHMNELRRIDSEFLTSDEARRIGEQVLVYQRVTGGWPKNIDMCRPHSAEELEEVRLQRDRTDDSTTDNLATTTQMTFIARMFGITGDIRYKDAFKAGVEYLLSGQYENGGWPQFWPNPTGYQIHISCNADTGEWRTDGLELLKRRQISI